MKEIAQWYWQYGWVITTIVGTITGCFIGPWVRSKPKKDHIKLILISWLIWTTVVLGISCIMLYYR